MTSLTRRSFLGICAAAGVSRALPAFASPPSGDTWALLSDIHISRDIRRAAWGSCMADNLRGAVSELIALGADQVLVNGDLAYSSGHFEDYVAFSSIMAPLRQRGVPMHMTLGNHDHRLRFLDALKTDCDRVVAEKAISSRRIGLYHWLFLDSLERTKSGPGSLGARQQSWLKQQLDANPSVPTVICLHHNPERSRRGLRDYLAFQDAILPRRQVKLVLFGHTHVFRAWEMNGLHFVNLPALGYPHQIGEPTGWLSAKLRDDGARLTFHGVSRRARGNGQARELRWRANA